MPELAEVDYFRRRWDPGLGRKVAQVSLNPKARVGRGVDRAALADLLVRLSRVRERYPQIAEIDLNPVIAYPDGYAVVDARIITNRSIMSS